MKRGEDLKRKGRAIFGTMELKITYKKRSAVGKKRGEYHGKRGFRNYTRNGVNGLNMGEGSGGLRGLKGRTAGAHTGLKKESKGGA